MDEFNAYIDGFSLYKGALESRPSAKWLNLINLCQSRVSNMKLKRICYFTARIKSRYPGDTAQHRQHKYLRVLKDQGIEIIEGKFLKDTDWLRQANSSRDTVTDPHLPAFFGMTQFGISRIFKETSPDFPKSLVWKYGEKGSDVNLASYLLRDVFRYDTKSVLVISGDSDLTTPLKMVKESGAIVQLLHPRKGVGSAELRSSVNKFEELHSAWLSNNLLPNPYITSNGGNIVKPSEW